MRRVVVCVQLAAGTLLLSRGGLATLPLVYHRHSPSTLSRLFALVHQLSTFNSTTPLCELTITARLAVMTSIVIAKLVAITASLVGSGGIFALSLFDIPELRAQPASRSLPSIRWLFSRGSHIFPQAAFIASASFATLAYHAYTALPASKDIVHALLHTQPGWTVLGYLLASALSLSIAPFTQLVMIPSNFELIKHNINLGGSRSQASEAERNKQPPQQQAALNQRSAKDSVNGKGEYVNELSDLSDPQAKAPREASREEEERVRALLTKFGWLNAVRGVLLGAGGMVGLAVAVAGTQS